MAVLWSAPGQTEPPSGKDAPSEARHLPCIARSTLDLRVADISSPNGVCVGLAALMCLSRHPPEFVDGGNHAHS
eukprot:CAMPEP_0171113686 /NCGR_PEP_ID=MMETSP0766_2-20121228/83225_1 /TAXON_ID=439317 /ORGANISM="Gambierdiscus australes, Strain CAWD 149" /LENGTH=73 /DNA_ID=CAMNT_0011575921 /DNA_START=74 /DNA_END=291 /DNA_ORIENTATION=+